MEELQQTWHLFVEDILGLRISQVSATDDGSLEAYKGAVDMLLNMRLEAKRQKDWTTSDNIRNQLTALGFNIKDTKDGFEWSL